MDIKKLQALVIHALEDVKGQNIRAFDTVHLTSLFDRIAIASGTSNRQTRALAASVRDKVKEHGGTVVSVEGEDTGEWVLVDLGDMIVHIMQPAIRDYYRLEEIWGEKEVNLEAAKRLPKRTKADGNGEGDEKSRRAARQLTASRLASEEAPKKAAPRKTAAKKTTAAKTTAVKKTAAKAAKKTAAKSTTAAKRTTAAKSTTAAKKAPAKRAPSKTKAAE